MTHTKTGMFKSWHGVKIRQLTDNPVYVPADDEMAVITVHFEGDVKPRTFVMALNGRVPTFVDRNGLQLFLPVECHLHSGQRSGRSPQI